MQKAEGPQGANQGMLRGTSFLLPLIETQNQAPPTAPSFAQHGDSPPACQELWSVAAAEPMSQHPTCLGGLQTLKGAHPPGLILTVQAGPRQTRKWGVVTQGWRLGKLGAQSPLNLALQLAQLPSPEIHVLLSCFQVFKV